MPTSRSMVLLFLFLLPAAACAVAEPRASGPVPRPLPAPAAPAAGEPQGEITLADALAAAIYGNPDLAAASLDVRAAEARALTAGRLPNPEIEIGADEFGGNEQRGGFENSEISFGLSQEILTAGKAGWRESVASLERSLAEWDHEAARLDVMARTTLAFVEVLSAQERLAAAGESLRLSEESARLVRAQADAGKVATLEADRVAVSVSLERLRLSRARRDLDVARRALAAEWGATEARFTRALGDLRAVRPVPPPERVLAALAGNPDLARFAAEEDLASARVALAEAEAWPDLTLTGGATRFREDQATAFFAGIAVPLPLFDRNEAAIAEGRAGAARVREARRAAGVKAAREADEAYRSLVLAAEEAGTLAAEVVPLARKTLAATEESLAQGKAGYLEVLDAQRTLSEATQQHIDALVSYHRAVAALERLIGRSLSALGSN